MRPYLKRIPVLRTFHDAAALFLRGTGFKFQQTSSGPSPIGLWRYPLRSFWNKPTGRKIVLIPGIGDTPLSWLPVLVKLKFQLRDRYDEFILLDYPGYGGFLSEKKPFVNFKEQKRETLKCLADLEPTVLIGHSMGGWLATEGALKLQSQGKSVEQLILVTPSGVFLKSKDQREIQRMFYAAVSQGVSRLRPHMFHREPKWFSWWFKWIEEELNQSLKNETTRDFFESIEEGSLLNSRIAKLETNVSILWGERDTLLPYHQMKDWTEGLKGVERGSLAISLKDCGHSPQVEKRNLVSVIFSILLKSTDSFSRQKSFEGKSALSKRVVIQSVGEGKEKPFTKDSSERRISA